MDLLHHYRKLFEYDAWANRAVAEALRTKGNPPAAALKRLTHILDAEELWLARLEQRSFKLEERTLPLAECEQVLAELPEHWRRYLKSLTAEDLEARIPYINSKGESFANTVQDILTHVTMHSAYHRGQVAVEMRAAGEEPVYTDFIHAVRQQLTAE